MNKNKRRSSNYQIKPENNFEYGVQIKSFTIYIHLITYNSLAL